MSNQNLKRQTISGLAWKMAERISNQIVRFVIMIVLARLLMPEDYGAIALVIIFVSLCDVILISGLGSPLIQKKEVDNADFSTILYCSLLLSILFYVLLYISAPSISYFYEMDVLCPVLRVLGIGVIISAISSVQNAYVSRNMQFKTFFFATLIGLLASGIIGIYMAYNGWGIWSLVGQTLSNQFINMLVVFLIVRWFPEKVFSFKKLREMWSFGWKILVATIINQLFGDIRTIIIGKFYSKQDLAFYNQGNSYPHLIVNNVNSSISSVLFPAIAKIQDDIPAVRNFLRRSIKTGSFVLFPTLFLFAAMSEPLVSLLLTDKWLPSVPIMQVICLSMSLSPISTPSQQAIKALGRSDITMQQEIIKKSVFLLIIIITSFIGVWAIVIGTAIGEIWCVVVNTYPNKKILNYSYLQQFRDIAPNGACAAVMATVVYIINFIGLSLLTCVITQIILGCVIYFVLCAITGNETYYYCLSNIKKLKSHMK